MENKYELFINLNNEIKKIYIKYFEEEKYELLINEEKILLARKTNNKNKINLNHELEIVKLIKSMAKRQKANGILYINLTKEINTILQRTNNENNIKCTDNRISWPIRQAFTKAIILKENSKFIK